MPGASGTLPAAPADIGRKVPSAAPSDRQAAVTGPHAHGARTQRAAARSRNANFWIFPVEVFGSSQNTTVRGTL